MRKNWKPTSFSIDVLSLTAKQAHAMPKKLHKNGNLENDVNLESTWASSRLVSPIRSLGGANESIPVAAQRQESAWI
jgi:hypothetical protein